jgi:hypothetical protein
LGRSRGLAAHDLVNDFILVDGMGNGLANTRISANGVPGLLEIPM